MKFKTLALCSVVLAGLALAGCRETTYKIPTETRAISGSLPVEQIDRTWVKRINAKTFELAAGGETISGAALSQTLALLLNSSEGTTATEIQKAIGISDKETSDYGDTMNALTASYAGTGLKVSTGLFMIWPILLTPQFQEEMAMSYGADIVRLGSAGQGATNALNNWVKARSGGAVPQFIPRLNRELIMVLATTQTFTAQWEKAPTKREDGSLQFPAPNLVATTDALRVVAIPLKGGRFSLVLAQTLVPDPEGPAAEMAKAIELAQSAQEVAIPVTLPTISLTPDTDLAKLLSPRGMTSLWNGPLDMPQVAMELRGGQQRIGMARQTFAFTVGAEGIGVGKLPLSPAKRPGERVFLLDKQTGFVVLTGSLSP